MTILLGDDPRGCKRCDSPVPLDARGLCQKCAREADAEAAGALRCEELERQAERDLELTREAEAIAGPEMPLRADGGEDLSAFAESIDPVDGLEDVEEIDVGDTAAFQCAGCGRAIQVGERFFLVVNAVSDGEPGQYATYDRGNGGEFCLECGKPIGELLGDRVATDGGRDDDSHAERINEQLQMVDNEDSTGDLPLLHVGDHVVDRENEDGPTMLVVGLVLKQADEYEVNSGQTLANMNSEYPHTDDVVEIVYPSRTDVDTRPLDRYAFPRSRLALRNPIHNREDGDGDGGEE